MDAVVPEMEGGGCFCWDLGEFPTETSPKIAGNFQQINEFSSFAVEKS